MADPAELEARIVSLEAQVRELSDALKARAPTSMRDMRRCPNCEGTTLLSVAATQFTPTEAERIGPLGLVQTNTWKGPTVLGPLEYIVCRQCGLVETHARELGDLDQRLKGVRKLESEPDVPAPPRGPYR
ncbi:MAG TPA: hypothetical protein VGM90_28420 [Kofleriaceae bacterium]|jgi:hypothetical protein